MWRHILDLQNKTFRNCIGYCTQVFFNNQNILTNQIYIKKNGTKINWITENSRLN